MLWGNGAVTVWMMAGNKLGLTTTRAGQDSQVVDTLTKRGPKQGAECTFCQSTCPGTARTCGAERDPKKRVGSFFSGAVNTAHTPVRV